MAKNKKQEENQAKIADFCAGGKTANEIAEFVGLDVGTVRTYLSKMRREQMVYKVQSSPKRVFGNGGVACFYIKTGTELTHEPLKVESEPVDEGPHWNEDFIRVAHKCLHLGAI